MVTERRYFDWHLVNRQDRSRRYVQVKTESEDIAQGVANFFHSSVLWEVSKLNSGQCFSQDISALIDVVRRHAENLPRKGYSEF